MRRDWPGRMPDTPEIVAWRRRQREASLRREAEELRLAYVWQLHTEWRTQSEIEGYLDDLTQDALARREAK